VAGKKPVPKVGKESYEDKSIIGRESIELGRESVHHHGRKLRKEEVYAVDVLLGREGKKRAIEIKSREGSYSRFAEDVVFLREKLIQYGLDDMLADLDELRRRAAAKAKTPLHGIRRKVVLTKEAHEAAERIAQSGEDLSAFLRELSLIRERLYVHSLGKFVNFVDYLRDVVKEADSIIDHWEG
jgi:hypothetical protein